MKCSQIRNLLNSFYDRELPPDQARDVDQHLARCIECRNKIQSLRRLDHEMLQSLSPEPSHEFTANVMAAIRRIPTKKSVIFHRWVPGLSYSIIFGTVLLLGILWNPQGAAEMPSASVRPSWLEVFEDGGAMHLSQLQDPYLNSIWSETNEKR